MANTPRKALVDQTNKGRQVANLGVRKLNTTGRKNRSMGASIRGRQHGGGFPKNQV
jgi:hypothetical protein